VGDGRRFLRDSVGVFGGQVAMVVIGVGTSVITARTLGPEGRGHLQLLMMFPMFLANFVKLGIPQASVYCIRRRGAAASAVASQVLVLGVAFGLVLAVGCWLGREWLLASMLRGVPENTLPPVFALFPFVLVQAFFLGVLQAEERFGEYNFQQVAPAVLGLVGMSIALLWMRAGLLGAVLVQTLIVGLVSVWLVVRVHRRTPLHLDWDTRLTREMLEFGGKSYVQTLAATLHRSIDQYMMNMFIGAGPVGLYAVAVNLTNFLLKIPDAIGTVLFPRLAALSEREAHAATSRVCRLTLFLTASAGLAYACLGGLVIRTLYGPRFEGSIRPMLLMLPGIVMMSLYLILTRNFTSRNRQGVNILAAAIALGTNVSLNCLLIPRWGVEGAAVSTGVSYSLAALMLLAMFVRESGHTVGETLVVGRGELESLARIALGTRDAAVERGR
jgi:O-antigen/teichoic acid export membrane protein